jgi:hypothetical protein
MLRALAVAVYADESPPCVIALDDDTLLVAVLVFPEARMQSGRLRRLA